MLEWLRRQWGGRGVPLLCAALLNVAAAHLALAQDISGSGSTFAFPVISRWAEAYQQATGTHVTFQPIGSGAGITELQSGLVNFAVSDAPLVDSQLLRDGMSQFPIVIGAIVPVVNLDGVAPGQVHLTGTFWPAFILARSHAGTMPQLFNSTQALCCRTSRSR
jgi:ABC-type phosphate transport system substrate-binding protein